MQREICDMIEPFGIGYDININFHTAEQRKALDFVKLGIGRCDFPVWRSRQYFLPRSLLLQDSTSHSFSKICLVPTEWLLFSAYALYSTSWHCSSTSPSLLLTTRSCKRYYHWSAHFVHRLTPSDLNILLTAPGFHRRGHCISRAIRASDTLTRHQTNFTI
jgi:hypothetical protein